VGREHLGQSSVDDEALRTAVVELVAEDIALESGVQRNEDRPQLRATEPEVEEFGSVEEECGDPVPLLHPLRMESGGDPIGTAIEFEVGQGGLREPEGDPVAVLLRLLADETSEVVVLLITAVVNY
jgi:hypothetical protein